MNRKIVCPLLLTIFLTIGGITGCGGGGGSAAPPPGFSIHTQANVNGTYLDNGGVFVNATHSQPFTSTVLEAHNNLQTSVPGGYADVSTSYVPGDWTFQQQKSSQCKLPTTETVNVTQNHQIVPLVCTQFGPATTASPSSIDATAMPASFTVSNSDVSNTNGTPKVQIYDQTGVLQVESLATSVANGSSVTAQTSNLTGLYSGTYIVVVVNNIGSGWEAVGGTNLDITGNYPPPPPDPCIANPRLECSPQQ